MSTPPPLPFTPPPGIPVIFQLGWVPSGKNVCVKNVFARYYKFSWDKMKKYIFSFMLIWCLIISRTFFVNNQPQRRCLTQTTRITSSAKEPVTFKLNATWTLRWITRVRQIVRLNLKMERSWFWMDNPPDFIHLFPSILTHENGQCDLRRFLPFSFGWRGLKLAGTYTETRLHFGFSKINQP